MIIHCEDEFVAGQYVNEPLGVLYQRHLDAYVPMPPFQVLEEVTIKEYTEYVTEYYGEEFLPSPGLETFHFYRISVD